MIKCKEDLLNTYIENDNGEVLYEYLSACRRFGFKWFEGTVWDWKFCYATDRFECPQQSVDDDFLIDEGRRKLTLSDLKPKRTKVEYKKVDIAQAWVAAKYHEGRALELWRKSDINDAINGAQWKAIQSPGEAAQYYSDLYRKVEKPVEWWEAAAEYATAKSQSVNQKAQPHYVDTLYVKARMTKEQWKEFARLILEGEE